MVRNAAMYVDFENVYLAIPPEGNPSKTVFDVLKSLRDRLGDEENNIIISRAYADWAGYPEIPAAVTRAGMETIYVLGCRGKNSADITASLDAQELLLRNGNNADVFVIVTGDRDFIPVARRIVGAGKQLVIASFGRCLSDDLRNFASESGELIDLDEFLPADVKKLAENSGSRAVMELAKLILRAANQYGDEIWVMPFMKKWMNDHFHKLTNDGRKKLLGELAATGAITVEQRQKEGDVHAYSVIIPNRDNEIMMTAKSLLG